MDNGIHALRNKRMQRMPVDNSRMDASFDNPEMAGNPVPENVSLQEYWDKILSIEEKLDQVLEAVGKQAAATQAV